MTLDEIKNDLSIHLQEDSNEMKPILQELETIKTEIEEITTSLNALNVEKQPSTYSLLNRQKNNLETKLKEM